MSASGTKTKKAIPQEENQLTNDQLNNDQAVIEQVMQYEKRIYDLGQMLDIAKSFCSTLDFSKLLESIVYICMAQMHVLGAEIFVLDMIENQNFYLETSKVLENEKKLSIPVNSVLVSTLLELQKPVTIEELKSKIGDDECLEILKSLSPTLVVPLIQKKHLNGLLILQERIAIDDDTSYSEYEQNQIMSIASLASVAINNANLLQMSSTDMMTHLKLKYFFFNVLTEAIDNAILQSKSIAVLMFDIDFFKKFNDAYGHECGDFVLTEVANLIKNNLRESDVASRYGGEEFTALLYHTKKTEAMRVAKRIRTTIEDHDFVYGNKHLHVTISCGVSVFDAKVNKIITPNILVDQADKALYVSKNTGRNKVSFYTPSGKKKSTAKSSQAKSTKI